MLLLIAIDLYLFECTFNFFVNTKRNVYRSHILLPNIHYEVITYRKIGHILCIILTGVN